MPQALLNPAQHRNRCAALVGTHRLLSAPPSASLRHGFVWLAFGNVFNAACAWARLVVLAHCANSEVIGQLALAWALCNPISSLFDLGLSSALVSDARDEFRLRDYVSLRLLTAFGALLAIIVVLALGLFGSGGLRGSSAGLVVAAGLVVVGESICEIFQAQTQRSEAMAWVSLSLVLRGALGLGGFTSILVWTNSVTWAVAGLAGAALVTLLAIDIPAALRFGRSADASHDRRFLPSWPALARLAWLSLPLGLATASLDLTTALPRYAVHYWLGTAALGSFAVAGGMMVAASLVVGAMSQAASPRLAKLYAVGNIDGFLRLAGRLLLLVGLVGALAAVGMTLLGKTALHYLYGPRYVPLAPLAALLTAIAGLRNLGMALGRTLGSMRMFRTNLLLRMIGLAALAVMLPGWVAYQGSWGAAWAMGISWLVSSLLGMAAVLKGARDCGIDNNRDLCRKSLKR